MKYKNTYICFVAPPMPKELRPYLVDIMRKAPGGRDGQFCSPYMEIKWNEFPWEDRGISKPSLEAFCRWAMAVCKKGIGKKNKKTINKDRVPIKEETRREIIQAVESVVGKDELLHDQTELCIVFQKEVAEHGGECYKQVQEIKKNAVKAVEKPRTIRKTETLDLIGCEDYTNDKALS